LKILYVAKIKILIFVTIFFIGNLFFSAEVFSQNFVDLEVKNVILLNSYHIGFKWTDQITEGFLQNLEKDGLDINLHVENMNWKKYPTNENLTIIYERLKYKYADLNIDAIAVSDDIAFEFALEHRDELFSSAPIIFSGLNDLSFSELAEGHRNLTGVIEKTDIRGLIETILMLKPELKSVYLLHDLTESGQNTGKRANEIIRDYFPDLSVNVLGGMTHGDVLKKASLIQEEAIILILAYTTDVEGQVAKPGEFINELSQVSAVPILGTYDDFLGFGILGGRMISGWLMGEIMAGKTLQVLSGLSADEIPIMSEPILRNAYDYEQLSRFGLSVDLLDDGAEIINRPVSFFEAHRNYVLATSGAIAVLALFLIYIIVIARKLKKTKDSLLKSNQEITQVHEELIASEEELRSQLEELLQTQDYLQKSEDRYRLAIEATNDAITDFDVVNNTYTLSERWAFLTGYSIDEISKPGFWDTLIHEEDKFKFSKKSIDKKSEYKADKEQFEYRIKNKSGEYRWMFRKRLVLFDLSGNPIRAVSTHSDITEMKKAQENLEYMLYNNHVTGLPNKRALVKQLDLIITKDEKECMALIFIDIDNFKLVNNSFGHSFGDVLLRVIGEKIKKNLENSSEVYSASGANFIVLQHFIEFAEVEETVANLRTLFKQSFEVSGISVNLVFTAGIARYPLHGKSAEELLKNTDIALYEAKKIGQGQSIVFGQSMTVKLMERLLLEKCLREAVFENQFSLNFQPQVSFKTGKVTMFEALLRWNSPQLGNVSPLKFIKVAEENRQIIEIGEWVIKEALAFLNRVHLAGFTEIGISINLSLIQILHEGFGEFVMESLNKYGFSKQLVEFEITESVFMESLTLVNQQLFNFTDNGLKIALDDFGTGYSSLNYLKEIPVVKIKIDKSFIDEISMRDDKKTLLDFIVMAGKRLGKETVAEGVETLEQFEYLLEHGCDYAQGYLLAKPMSEVKALEYLEQIKVLDFDEFVFTLRNK